MRIVHICQRDDPEIGGSLRVAEALVKEQTASGLHVLILFLYGPPARVSAQFNEDQVICLRLHSSKEAWRGIGALRKTIRSIAPDIIHSHDGITWPRLALFRIGIPVVMHAHLGAWNPRTLQERMGWALITRTTDFLIGISHHTIGSWVEAKFSSSRIRYIPNGVDFRRFHILDPEEKKNLRRSLGLPESKNILVWVGRLNRHMKGSDRVEYVAARLPAHTVLLVVGHGLEFDDIQVRCRQLLDSGKMVMTGTVFEPASYYMAADAFMFTSHYEPFGLVLLEAMACGLPIMAFPLEKGGGAEKLFDEFQAVRVENEMDEREIENAIQELMSKREHAVELRAAAEEKYSWRVISEEVVDTYHFVLGSQPLRILVCQHGARHRYAIPRMLESAGVLSAFYTDTSEKSFLGKCMKLFAAFFPVKWQRFARWDVKGIPKNKVFSSDYYYLPELFQRVAFLRKKGIFLYQQRHHYLSSKMKKWGMNGANLVYTMYHENLDFVRWAKKQGAKSVIDVFVSPLTDEIMTREKNFFGDWNGGLDQAADRLEQQLWEETVEEADILLCPSEWVAEGVRTISPSAADKIRLVPYGSSFDYEGKTNSPVPGRVLFAGREALRKGLHYLAWATTELRKEIPELDVRVAGSMPPSVVTHPCCEGLNFLGQLSSDQLKEEYLSAEAFVLPALSEGFASAVAESIAAGCPVIVTRETGTPIVHEREGLIVPSRDIEALTAAMRRMISDREFRNQCSRNCIAQASYYSEPQWKERLINELHEFSEW